MAGFTFNQLDDETRRRMLEEHTLDRTGNRVYLGKRLNTKGDSTYEVALPDTLTNGTPETLQAILEPIPGDLWIPSTNR